MKTLVALYGLAISGADAFVSSPLVFGGRAVVETPRTGQSTSTVVSMALNPELTATFPRDFTKVGHYHGGASIRM